MSEGAVRPVWSLAMIVKDEEATLGAVLEDASAFCDELVVVDTGSADGTRTVAASKGAKVFDFEWIDDFSAARNCAFGHCTGEWIVWLDADDRVPPAAQEGFLRLKEELPGHPEVLATMVPYRLGFADPAASSFSVNLDRERVIRNGVGLQWVGAVHEFVGVPPGGTMRWPEAWVEHRPTPGADGDTGRNLRILERAVAGGDRSPRTLFYLGNELRDHQRWEEAMAAYRQYLASSDSVVWERYSALLFMAGCAGELGRSEEKVDILLATVKLDSTRAEAFMHLGLHHYHRREWANAVAYFTAASVLTRPDEGFVEEMAYTWGPWDYLSVCHAELGLFEEALDETVEALRTSPERPRLMANLQYYLDELKAKASDS